jgi:hypothetical protein
MPLLRYFGFVGTALLTLLWASHWLLPGSTAEPVRGDIDKTFIRISSIETLPEKVVFDTSMPHVAPSPGVAPPRTVAAAAAPVRTPPVQIPSIEAAPIRSAFVFAKITPGPLPGFTKASYVFLDSPDIGKRATPAHDKTTFPKKVAGHRTLPPVNAPTARAQAARAPEPVTRLSLIDVIKGRLSRGLF